MNFKIVENEVVNLTDLAKDMVMFPESCKQGNTLPYSMANLMFDD
jgi:hypothetical protein